MGCRDINPRGRIIEDFFSDENLCIFHDDTTTCLHPALGSATAIELSLCDPDLYLDYTWRSMRISVVEERVQHWRLHRANLEAFQQSCGESLTIYQFESEKGFDDPTALFTAEVNKISDKTYLKPRQFPEKSINPGLIKLQKGNRKKGKILAKIKKNI